MIGLTVQTIDFVAEGYSLRAYHPENSASFS